MIVSYFGNLIYAHNRVRYSILKKMNPNKFINSAEKGIKKFKDTNKMETT